MFGISLVGDESYILMTFRNHVGSFYGFSYIVACAVYTRKRRMRHIRNAVYEPAILNKHAWNPPCCFLFTYYYMVSEVNRIW